jgi:CRISPR-associated Csx2 family protein
MYKGNGYEKTTYQFANGQTCETSLLLKAVLEAGPWQIRKIILVGTLTSSWDALIPGDGNADADLWLTIKDECKTEAGISEESRAKLEQKLPQWYNLPVVLKIHTAKLDAADAEQVFSVYSTIAEEIAPDTDILFDITHGFRSMPILIYQALQLDAINTPNRDINLIYGEYVDGKTRSIVRDLSKYWDFYEITLAKKLFDSRFDGALLAEKMRPLWESGAKCVERFSKIIECNYALQVPESLRQLKNALGKFDHANSPRWLIDVKNDLERIYKRLNVDEDVRFPLGKTLRQYSKLLEEKGLITQAVIALQIAIETVVTEKCGASEYIGDYQWWQDYGKIYFSSIRKKDNAMSASLKAVENLRNQIAHGGAKDRNTGEFPHITSLAMLLKKGNAAADTFFALLDDE